MAQLPLANWQRYVHCLFKYGSTKKYKNLLRSYGYYLQNTPNISSFPSFLKVEISRHCTVKCKYCFPRKEEVYYPYSQYKELVNYHQDCCFLISLYDIGEPLHNKDVVEYIKYAHARNVGTVISTSLSIAKEGAFWRSLMTSGLDYLIVSIDGVSPGIYNQYRRYGDLKLVLDNLKKVLEYRRMMDSKTCIEWQMIDFPWNKAEQQAAKQLAINMGCDKFRLVKEAVQLRAKYKKADVQRKRNCLLPYVLFSVDVYNNVRLCYKIYDENMVIGNLNDQTFENIWNGSAIAVARDKHEIKHRPGCRTCRE